MSPLFNEPVTGQVGALSPGKRGADLLPAGSKNEKLQLGTKTGQKTDGGRANYVTSQFAVDKV